ncbi:hypothetical protein AB0J86_00010 [Micromonospora sp. NPDC049559]|uniref:hypothetical protein n=1 Tax=Micromonospora sp. NPDC049559 TaxID=3155923 RepID=UPI0034465192
MTEGQSTFPRRDTAGRISGLGDLLGVVLAGLVVGVLALVLFDWVVTIMGTGEFGRANGWLALILPAWIFVEDFRAWPSGPARVVTALVSAAVAVTAGLLAAGLAQELPTLWSGALAATVAAGAYAAIWFHVIRWLDRRTG